MKNVRGCSLDILRGLCGLPRFSLKKHRSCSFRRQFAQNTVLVVFLFRIFELKQVLRPSMLPSQLLTLSQTTQNILQAPSLSF